MDEENVKNIKYWVNYSNIDLILALKNAKLNEVSLEGTEDLLEKWMLSLT